MTPEHPSTFTRTNGRPPRVARPLFISAVVHALALMALAFTLLPSLIAGPTLDIVLDASDEILEITADDVELAIFDSQKVADETAESAIFESGAAVAELKLDDVPFENVDLASTVPTTANQPSVAVMLLEPSASGGYKPPHVAPAVETKGRVSSAATVEQAVDLLASNIQSAATDGDLRVVWLFDASISLLGDRQKIAHHLATVLQSLRASTDGTDHKLLMGAAAFGATTQRMVKSTTRLERIMSAAMDTRYVDQTGRENVCTAIQATVREFGERWQGKLLIVVWTDEAGDDIGAPFLENTIQYCQENDTAVCVVGPSSMFNRRKGTQNWRHPAGYQFRLPVDRGPDTALPQRLYVPYWWHGQFGPPALQQNLVDQIGGDLAKLTSNMVMWHEGNQLQNLSSAFGPYALTRLAMATGGTFTLFDRPDDRSRFALEKMKAYEPDYRSAADILRELPYYPLRWSVFQSVQRTEQFLTLPAAMPPVFFGGRAGADPTIFQRRLSRTMVDHAKNANRIATSLQFALEPFGAGMEHLHELETSQRWKAWYDLTRGRLLAQQARYLEYSANCQWIASGQGLFPTSNVVRFSAASRLLAPQVTGPLAEEAKRHLTRCIEEHPGTPWAVLAQRELDHPVGLAIWQDYIPPPPPPPPTPIVPLMPSMPAGPAITIPNL